jgi:endonuclease I/hydrogenase maturation factor
MRVSTAIRRGLAGVALWAAAAVLIFPGTAHAAVQVGDSLDTGLAASYFTGDQTLTSGVWNTTAVYKEAAGASYGGSGASARLNDDTAGAFIRTPVLNTAGSITFWYRELNSGGGDFILQKSYDDSAWVDVATQAFSGNTYVQYSNDVNDAAATIYLRVLNDNQKGHLLVDEFEITDYSAASTAPVFDANPGPVSATVDVAVAFTVGATGSPEPVLALESTTAASGYSFTAGTGELSYTPSSNDLGSQTFTFTASNSVGMATQVVSVSVSNAPVTAPVFNALGSQTALVGSPTNFTVSAAGYPAPVLALDGTTASSGYSFTAVTGELSYTAPLADVGTPTFTFTASNSAGVATQVVSVSVAEGPFGAPGSIWASVTNTTDFTAAWSSVSGAIQYELDVSTNATFGGGGGGANLMSNAGFETGDSTDWDKFETEYSVVSTDPQEGSYHVTCPATGTRDLMQAVDITGDGVTEVEVSYWYTASGGNTRIWASWASGGQDSGDSLLPGTYNAQTSEWTKVSYTVVPSSGANTLNFEVRTYGGATATYDNFFVGQAGGGGTPDYVSGYSNLTVAGTSQSVTGLSQNTEYFFRARAVSSSNTSANSSTANVTTGSGDTPPVFAALGAQSTTTGVALAFTVGASGNPAPVLALQSTTASSGYSFTAGTGELAYTPPLGDAGAQTFTFTASNTTGVATQVVDVSVTAVSAPVFAALGTQSTTTDVALAFTVSATGVPDPVLALQSTTASSGYSFTAGTGELTYTAPFADIGSPTFTFTASNTTGVATQIVTVTVSDLPATLPVFNVLGAQTALVGSPTNFTVSATGYPAPVLALDGTTASLGYSFTAGIGELSYTAPLADVGTPTFTFIASNSAGIATQVVSVSVGEGPFGAPGSIWASVTNTTDFTAAWSSVSGAISYELDVSTNAIFGGGGGGGTVQVGDSLDSGLAASYTTGDQTLTSGVWNTVSVFAESATASYGGSGSAARINDDTSGACIRTPVLNTAGTLTFWYRELTSGGGDFILQKSYDDSAWVDVATQAFSGTTFVLYSNDVNDAAATIYLRVLNDNQAGHLIVDEFEITSFGSGTPDYVPGYSNLTVAGTSQSVTGLTQATEYFFRARAVSVSNTSANSSTANVTTGTGDTPPVFAGLGAQSATVGVASAFTVGASGNPVPALSLDSTTASSGYSFTAGTGELAYTPPVGDLGAQSFTFMASNTLGVATQVVSVTVAAAPTPPLMDAISAQTATVGVDYAYTVTATEADGDAVSFACTSAVDTNTWLFDTNSGYLFFIATTNEIGGVNFSFTATDKDGTSAPAVMSVTVSDAPATLPVFDAMGTQSTTVDVESVFTVSATGYPDPALALQSTTATGTVAFSQSTGELTYTPASGDEGTNTFTFTASNTVGVATQTVSVIVSPLPDIPDPPASVWASDTNSTEFTAAWSPSAGATGYRLDVASNATFAVGGSGGVQLGDSMDSGLAGTYTTGDQTLTSGVWNTVSVYQEASATSYGGSGAAARINDDTAGACIRTPELNTVGTMSFWYRELTSGGGDFKVQKSYDASAWVDVSTQSFSGTTFTQHSVDVNDPASTIYLRVLNDNQAGHLIVDEFEITAYGSGTPSYVPGYSNLTVAGTSQSVTGLTENTEYFFQIRAVNGVETSSNSAVASVTTLPPTLIPPTLDPVSPITVSTGETATVWIMARETDGDTVTLFASNLPANASFTTTNGTGVVSNLFSFTPAASQTGQTYAVVFYAGDIHGTNSVTLNLTVASADPWADYYATCYSNGVLKTGVDLKNALHNIIDDHTTVSYTQAEFGLGDIDECPTNSSMVQLLYLQIGRAKSNFGGGGGQWNREHVWANSHGIDDSMPGYSDLHHLHPTDVTVNSTRGNLDFDTVAGTSNSYSYDSGAFEPPDAGKGDSARAMFYMAVRYDGSDAVGDLELTNAVPTSTSSSLFGKLDTLMDWNELDTVNEYEIRRNNLVYSDYQGNRNPFVDHPEWARVIFDTNYIATPSAPNAFSAAANGSDQIDLSFTQNGSGDDVVIVWDNDGSFSDPSGTTPAVGQSFAGGTVLYKGAASPQSHTGRSACQTIFYKCWSVSGTDYSVAGLTADATTSGTDAPASIWASATNTTDFTVTWNAVSGVTNYHLDVATGPGFTGDTRNTIFRETMGTSVGTVLLADHETAAGFDQDAYTMTDGGADYPADIRSSSPSDSYTDPTGNAASGDANVYFTSTGLTNLGFAVEGIDTRGYEALALSFGYRKEDASTNMSLSVDWSTNSGAAWNPVTVSNMPAEGAASGWYMISNLTVSAAALESTNLSLRWAKNGGVAGRVDDILLQSISSPALYVPGYSNLAVTGATSTSVTGLTSGATVYFRVASEPNCAGNYSPTGSVTTLEVLAAPLFATNSGPFSTTVGVEVAFTMAASGSPAPVLSLAGTTASGGDAFDSGTGACTYTPPFGDIGPQTFTFTASNSQGVVTQVVDVTVSDWPAEAPVLTSGTAYGATTSVAMAFTVTATGYPDPTLAMTGTTASGGYSFDAGTGQLDYTPPEVDAGSPSFTFTASNATGVATQTVTVAVASGIPSAPASLWAGATNILNFTADWTAVPIATGYFLDVSPEADFQSAGGASVETVLASNAATSPALITNEWLGVDLGGTTYVVLTQATAEVISPAFSTVGYTNVTVDFESRTYGGTASSNITVSVSTNNGTDWTVLGVANPTNGSSWVVLPTLTHTTDLGYAQTRIRWQALDANAGVGVGVRSLLVKGWSPEYIPAYVAGYSNLTVVGISQAVTGLVADTPYYFRVRSENAAGTGADTATASVTTKQKTAQTIDFLVIGDQLVTNALMLSATASSGLAVSYAVESGPADLAGSNLTFTAAGDVSIVVSQAGDETWSVAPAVTNTFTVTKASAGVTLENLAQMYDGAGKAATATTVPAGLTVDFTYEGSSTAPSNAGSYAVTGTVNDVLYAGSAIGTLVLSKASATVTLGSLSQPYDGSSKSATATTVPASLTVEFTYDGSATAPTAAGSYAVTGAVNDVNYAGSTSGTLVVSKGSATVTLGALAQTFDGSDRIATATTAPAGLTVDITYDGSATAPTNAGTYAVTGTVNDVNYDGSAVDTLVVAKGVATVTLGALAQTFDGSDRIATATTAPTGLVVNITYDGSATAPTNAGSYSVTGTVNDVNYDGVAGDTLVVAKGSATVTLGALAQTFDGTDRMATATTVPAGLVVDVTYDGSAPAPTNAGSYAVTGTVNDVNYDGSASDVLVVSKGSATVTLGALAQTFDGSDRIATATTVPAGLTVDITYDGSAAAPSNAASYAVTGTVNDVNYDGSAADTLVVSKGVATVTLGALAQTFDGTDRIATATTVPSGLSVDITYDGSPVAPTNAGTYAVTGTVNDVNYDGSAVDTLVVGKGSATVTLGALAQTFDGTDRIATATTVPAGLTVNITYEGSPVAPTNAGSYAVTGTVNDVNYDGSAVDALVVSKGSATVTLGALAQTFDGTDRIATATTVPVGLIVDITYDGSATAPTNAGSYAVTGTVNDVNYDGSSVDTLVVAKGGATVTLGALAQTFDGSDRIATAITVPAGLTVDITYDGVATAPTNAGSYSVTGTVSDVNYDGVAGDTLVVAKGSATVTLGDLAQTFDGTDRMATATTVPAGLGVDITYDGSPVAPTNAGSYAVTGTVNDVNYDGSSVDTLVVLKANQTILFSAIADPWTTNEVTLSASATSGLAVTFAVESGPASIGGSLLTFSGPGPVSISASQAGDGNWNAALSQTNSFMVSKAAATVTLGNMTQAYDGSARAVSVTTVPAGLTVDATYDGNAWAPTNAGSYSVQADINEAMYQGSVTGLLTVSQATNPAVVTLSDLAQTYEGSVRVVTATTEPAGLTVEFTYNGSLTAPTDAGTYAVTGTVQDVNYTGSASGTLVVSKASAFVTLGDLAQTFDGSDRIATATTAPTGLVVNITYDGSATAPTNAGSYAVTGTVNDVNYDGFTSDTLVVSKGTATVALGALAQTFDGTDRIATATTVPAGLTVDITYDGSAIMPTNAGSYAVTGTVSDVNYDGFAADTLIVSKGAATVTLGDLAQTFDGSDRLATATTVPAGLTVNITYDGFASAPTNAGTYAVTGMVNDVNYDGSAVDTLVVGKGVATVTLGDLAQTFDGTDRIATATTVPAGLTVNITYEGSAVAPTNAGTYAVTGTVNDVNYDGSAVDTLIVSKGTAIVTLGALAQTFDGSDRIATATTVPAGLTVEFTYDGSVIAPSNAGSYSVTGTVNDVNYDGVAGDTLLVAKASATVALGDLAQTFDGTDRIATATTVPAGLTVDITYDGSATAPTNAGTYAVTGTVNDVNYDGSAVDTLVVSKGTATVTLGALAQTFDGSDRIATATTVPAGLTVNITYDGSAMAPTNAGTYAVTGTVNDVNYDGSAVDALVVAKGSATVTLGDLAQTFDGTDRIATATTVPAGLTVDITYDGSATVPTNAASYAVTGTVTDVNYDGSAVDTLVVSKALVTVTLESLLQTADGTSKPATATTVPAGLAVDLTYEGSFMAPSNAGSYAVTGTVNEVNYSGNASGTLVLDAAMTPFEVWLDDQAIDYEDSRYAEDVDEDGDGMTTYEEYLADTIPDNSNSVLALTSVYVNASDAGESTGQIRLAFPASTNRFYQLEYCTDLKNHAIGVTNIGWGVPGMVITNKSSGVWFGIIRSMLAEP